MIKNYQSINMLAFYIMPFNKIKTICIYKIQLMYIVTGQTENHQVRQ